MDCTASSPTLFDLVNNTYHLDLIVALTTFAEVYSNVHVFLALGVCLIGAAANIVHMSVLTRPAMSRNTVNRLLSLMAFCDCMMMVSYLVYLIRFNVVIDSENPPLGYSYSWICFLLLHVVMSISLHAVSLYLSVATAIVRVCALNKMQSPLMRPHVATQIFIPIFLTVCVLAIPTFMVHRIEEYANPDEPTGFSYMISLPRESKGPCRLFISNLWLTGAVFKVIPCLLMIIFTFILLHKLHKTKLNHEKIGSRAAVQLRSAASDRTTILLLLVLSVYILTELPQGILALLNARYPTDVHAYIYSTVGELFDLMSLLNGCACFLFYPCLSSLYCETFQQMTAGVRARVSQLHTRLVGGRAGISGTRSATNKRYSSITVETMELKSLNEKIPLAGAKIENTDC